MLGTGREAGRGQGTRARAEDGALGSRTSGRDTALVAPFPPQAQGSAGPTSSCRRRGDFRKTQLPRLLIYFARVSQKFHGASTLLLLLIKKSTGATFFLSCDL